MRGDGNRDEASPQFQGQTVVSLSVADERAKRAFDLGLATLSICILLPLLVSVSLILLAVQGRPLMSRRRLIGRNGIPFEALTFRTDMHGATTHIGHMLRATDIAELPQLWNILKGQMSFVGPRPVEATRITADAAPPAAMRPGLIEADPPSGEAALPRQTWTLSSDLALMAKSLTGRRRQA